MIFLPCKENYGKEDLKIIEEAIGRLKKD